MKLVTLALTLAALVSPARAEIVHQFTQLRENALRRSGSRR
jgi:hypothetical protein